MKNANKMYEKALKLQQKYNAYGKEINKTIDEWIRLEESAKGKECELINKKYSTIVKKTAKQQDKSYKDYYEFINNNFSQKKIDKAVKESRNFMGASFLKKLFKGASKK